MHKRYKDCTNYQLYSSEVSEVTLCSEVAIYISTYKHFKCCIHVTLKVGGFKGSNAVWLHLFIN